MNSDDKLFALMLGCVAVVIIAVCICSSIVDVEKEKTKQYELTRVQYDNVMREED